MNAGYLQESSTDPESVQNPLFSPGERLRKQRESIGLTSADVANHLNLRLTIIEAIENDEYKHLPKLVFARGYLRAYAKLLGIPGDEIIAAFNQLNYPENPPELPAAPLRHGQKQSLKKENRIAPWAGLIMLAIILLVIGFWESLSSFFASSVPSSQVAPSSPIIANQEKKPPKVDTLPQAAAATPVLPDLEHFKQQES